MGSVSVGCWGYARGVRESESVYLAASRERSGVKPRVARSADRVVVSVVRGRPFGSASDDGDGMVVGAWMSGEVGNNLKLCGSKLKNYIGVQLLLS